ncbi:hypothetical protein DESC_770023 [Desulfosarcina cetonica]|nr:hypothetical protein DESC_770023 [Desulfosarcina cetonica]
MTVEPEQDRIGNAHQGAAVRLPDDIAQGKGAEGKNHPGQHIPHRDIEDRLLAVFYGQDEVDEDQAEGGHHHDIQRPDQLGVFTSLGHAGGQAGHGTDQGDVPGDDGEYAQALAEKARAQQAGDEVKGRREQTRGDKTEQHQVDMRGPHASENDAAHVGGQVRSDQFGGPQESVKGGHHHPEGGCQGKPLGGGVGGIKGVDINGQELLLYVNDDICLLEQVSVKFKVLSVKSWIVSILRKTMGRLLFTLKT